MSSAPDLFPGVPDEARLWVFALARELAPGDHARVTESLDAMIAGWKSHGQTVRGAYRVLENRFVLITGHVDDGVSGCSTDSMVRVMSALRRDHGIDGFDRTLVFFREGGGGVRAVTRDEFQKLVESRAVGDDTVVFDSTIQNVGDLRGGRFETTFGRAWHARAFAPTD